MVFNFLGFKKKPVVEEATAIAPPPNPASMTFDEALATQVAAKAMQMEALTAPEPVSMPTPTIVRAETLADVMPEVTGQMDTLKATREDVIAAYKIFLGRLPESMEVVDPRVGVTPFALLVDFLSSKEFLDQAPKSQLVLAVAKRILDALSEAAPGSKSAPKA